jgi:hypothetical protein
VFRQSFYTAMRLMPKVERGDVRGLHILPDSDDIADDGTRPRPAAAALANGAATDALYAGRPAGQAAFLQGRCRPRPGDTPISST